MVLDFLYAYPQPGFNVQRTLTLIKKKDNERFCGAAEVDWETTLTKLSFTRSRVGHGMTLRLKTQLTIKRSLDSA
jgi:hypothetical protein